MSPPIRRLALALLALAAVGLVWALVARSLRSESSPATAPDVAARPPDPGSGAGSTDAMRRTPRPDVADRSEDRSVQPPGDESVDVDADFESALRWSAVDLDAVRAALPDNLYWEMSVPTTDPAELERREEERARWNRAYGQVLSGNASETEVHDYFALRRRISEDAVAFSEHLIEHYGPMLPERDLGLLELASRLHRARLEELPRREADALERMHEQDRLRAAWRADEAAFESAQAESARAAADPAARPTGPR